MIFPINHITTGLVLTLMISQGILARPEYGSFYPGLDIPQYILDETESMNDEIYSDMKKYPQRAPTYIANWPWSRSVMPAPSNNINDDPTEDKVLVPEPLPTPLPLQKIVPLRNLSRDHERKRNTNSRRRLYMSPCYFKICNMGKRAAPFSQK